jgi:hypothetical protein
MIAVAGPGCLSYRKLMISRTAAMIARMGSNFRTVDFSSAMDISPSAVLDWLHAPRV